MKKLLITVLFILTFTACSMSNTPKSKVEIYMNQFNSITENVKKDLETTVASENLSESNKEIYKKVLERQQQNLKYSIKDEQINGDNATVTVNITVYDFYKSNANAEKYYNEHTDEFTTSNGTTIDIDSYTKYRLEEMLKMSDTVDYEIKIHLNKENDEWVIQNPDRETLEKIHGLYDYENE